MISLSYFDREDNLLEEHEDMIKPYMEKIMAKIDLKDRTALGHIKAVEKAGERFSCAKMVASNIHWASSMEPSFRRSMVLPPTSIPSAGQRSGEKLVAQAF